MFYGPPYSWDYQTHQACPKQCSKHVFATENPSFVVESRVGRVVNFIKCQSWRESLKTLVVCNFQTLFEILNYSVWYAIHVNFIFSVFFGLMFNLKGPQGQNPRTTCGPRTTVWETLVYSTWRIAVASSLVPSPTKLFAAGALLSLIPLKGNAKVELSSNTAYIPVKKLI